ncbi:hypothetical protein DEO72_LG8g629 [Vigna unguiculata]|uniref:Uncharacterized protein n=1 Tax=Vigna unguiculata TaxID=3917 RepID=A0A4D6MPB0_VIGUN|nr:hypothetical protein DEO72_LG8g629 [Vigna unguiculata]
MSSSSAYYLSSRHSDSEEEGTAFDSPCSDSVQRDDEDSVGAEEFSALRHPGYEWVDPQVKLPLSRFSKSTTIVDFHKKYDILADTVDNRIFGREHPLPKRTCVLSYLDQLPKKLSSKKIIGVFSFSHLRDDLCDIMAVAGPSGKEVFLELRRKKLEEEKRKGGESASRAPTEMPSQKGDLMPPVVEKKKSKRRDRAARPSTPRSSSPKKSRGTSSADSVADSLAVMFDAQLKINQGIEVSLSSEAEIVSPMRLETMLTLALFIVFARVPAGDAISDPLQVSFESVLRFVPLALRSHLASSVRRP